MQLSFAEGLVEGSGGVSFAPAAGSGKLSDQHVAGSVEHLFLTER